LRDVLRGVSWPETKRCPSCEAGEWWTVQVTFRKYKRMVRACQRISIEQGAKSKEIKKEETCLKRVNSGTSLEDL
jgi:hypothetical protein